jgi:site-specific recombinase XerD
MMATFDRSVSRVTGPLARYAAGFTAELAAQGYGEASIDLHLRLVADLSVWLSGQGLSVEQLSPEVADRFVLAMRPTGRPLISVRGLAPVTGYLQRLDVVPEADLAMVSERDALLSAYQRYLRAERGVCERTVHAYTPSAVAFLAAVGDPLDEELACLSGPNVLDMLNGQLNGLRRRRSAAGTKLVAQADRSLLRFLYAVGHTSRELALVVPRVARWRLAGLPARLDAATIAALLASCDRGTDTDTGRRDYAVLLILVRLGLRSCEATHLTLDDLNWRAGEITIHGKGDQVEAFPLPWDIGEALVDYLHVRRAAQSTTRTVFLTVLPPYRELTSHGLGSIVLRSCRRAGVAECGPHVLRHSLASALLAAGASLTDVGEVLRHVDARTTAIYAKVDRTALAVLARPWPARPEPE